MENVAGDVSRSGVALSKKISFLLGNWGFPGQAHSYALSMAYNNLLIKVGLYGSPLHWNYNNLGRLALDTTWVQNLWLLASTYEVDISDMVQGIRKNDLSLMAEFHPIGNPGKQLAELNIVRCF
jgi:hypothetical protein